MLRAVIQAGAHVASISGPSGVAIALSLNALSVSRAALSVSRATSSAVSASPSVLARADTVEALSVSRAVIGACLLRAVIALVSLIALACHLSSNRHTLSVSRARRGAGREGAEHSSEAGLAEASSVVAISVSGALR